MLGTDPFDLRHSSLSGALKSSRDSQHFHSTAHNMVKMSPDLIHIFLRIQQTLDH
jgi:hypothetical protein